MGYFHSCDLRKGRYSELDRPYLITTSTYQRAPIFRDYEAGKLVANEIFALEEQAWVSIVCWVVMPDHLHWLFILRRGFLHRIVQRLKSRSAIAVNRYRGCCGRVWQSGFHDHALRKEEDVEDVARYVNANPLRADLVKELRDYPLWGACWVEGDADLIF